MRPFYRWPASTASVLCPLRQSRIPVASLPPCLRRTEEAARAVPQAQPVPTWLASQRKNNLSISSVVRALFHWLGGSRVKVKSRSPASSRLSATALHLSRHLRRKIGRASC